MQKNKRFRTHYKKKNLIILIFLLCSFIVNSQSNFNIYIENSGSMKGFFALGTNCDNTITNLKTNIPLLFPNCNLTGYLINGNSTVGFNLNNKLQKIPINKFDSTPIPEMLQMVIDRQINNNIGIFISDFIFDEGTSSVTLNRYKNRITDVYSKYKYDCLVLKLYSNFEGKYCAIDTQPIIQKGSKNIFPYYIFIFGKADNLIEVYTKIISQLEKPNNIIKECIFYNNINNVEPIDYQIQVGTKENKGRIECMDKINKNSLKSISLENRSKEIAIPIKVNLKNIKLIKSYLLDSRNYSVSPSNYTLKISPVSENNKYTHLFILNSNSIKNEDITITLNKVIPDWAKSKTLNDGSDSDIIINKEKTFGFSYLMQGIAAKYNYTEDPVNDSYFFKIQIPFGKNSDMGSTQSSSSRNNNNSSTKIFYSILLLSLGVSLVYYFIKKSKK